MTRTEAAYALVATSLAFAVAGYLLVAMCVAVAAGLVHVFGPTRAQRDARGRNPRPAHARRITR